VNVENLPREPFLFVGAAMNEDIFEKTVPIGEPLLETVNKIG